MVISWIIFIITWVLCFLFTYRIWYLDWSKDGDYSSYRRLIGIMVASLHLIGAIAALCVLLSNEDGSYGVSDEGFIGKMLSKLEK